MERKIQILVDRKKENDALTDKLYDVLGDSQIEEAIWENYDLLVDLTSELLGDDKYAISFFIFDCNCGKEGPSVSGGFPKFKKVKDVVKYIKERQ